MLLYVDSSVALRLILAVPERTALRSWFTAAADDGHRTVSSRLLRTEVIRTLRREGLPLSSADRVLSSIGLVALTDDVASVAESIERHIKTLDALHLATALKVGPTTVVTHDQNMADVARHLGLGVVDPVAEVTGRAVDVVTTHEIPDTPPIVIAPGDRVVVGERGPDDDGAWPAFVPVRTASGGQGWVPERYLSTERPTATVVHGYDTQELPAAAGERLTVLVDDAESGWKWCRNADGREGWVPDDVLR